MLKTLSLRGFRFTEVEIVSFLCRHSSTLSRLTIDGAHLDSGSWKGLLDCAREKLRLESVRMTRLRKGFEQPWEKDTWDDYGEVQAFYMGNGGNPFTWEAMEARYPQGHSATS